MGGVSSEKFILVVELERQCWGVGGVTYGTENTYRSSPVESPTILQAWTWNSTFEIVLLSSTRVVHMSSCLKVQSSLIWHLFELRTIGEMMLYAHGERAPYASRNG